MTQELTHHYSVAELFRMINEGRAFLAAGGHVLTCEYYPDCAPDKQYQVATKLGTFTSGADGKFGVTELTVPALHLNGSGYENLIEEYNNQANALQIAIRALETSGPHPRDYYVVSDTAYVDARSAHFDRIKALNKVYQEINAIRDALYIKYDLMKARKAGR